MKLSNPLTVIGVFAGLTEAAGAVALPFLEGGVQVAYVAFLIGFPTLLLLLFFGTLWLRPEALFSPDEHGGAGDYRKAVVDKRNRSKLLAAMLADPDMADRLRAKAAFTEVEEVIGDA